MDIETLIERLGENTDCWTDKVHGYADLRLEASAALSVLRAENEKLRAELESKEKYYEQMIDALSATDSFDLARVTAERDAIERDFRAFTKQWWEEANGFPCRFCKFENSGWCEQKAKHPDDEKPCAGRWFEWRGIKED